MKALLLAVVLHVFLPKTPQACKLVTPAPSKNPSRHNFCRSSNFDSNFLSDEKLVNVVIMQDNFNHPQLYPPVPPARRFFSPVWYNVDGDGDEVSWTDSASLCISPLRTCSFRSPNQNNWIFTQYTHLEDAQELFFNISYRLRQCYEDPECQNRFFTLYRYCVDNPVSKAEFTDPSNYEFLNTTREGSTLSEISSSTVRHLVRPKSNGCYFGFRDEGTCGSIERMVIHYKICEPRKVGLVNYPRYAVPPHQGANQVFKAFCACNAHPVTSLNVIASASKGTCTDETVGGARCECDGGYEAGLERGNDICVGCKNGQYRALGVSETCIACPLNTTHNLVNISMCPCLSGHFRSHSEGPEFPCTVPPPPVEELSFESSTSNTVTVRFKCPSGTGRSDSKFQVCATDLTDLSKFCGDHLPLVCDSTGYKTYIMEGLNAFSRYIVEVNTSNGVSDQDLINVDRRISEVVVFTTEGVPSEPLVKKLCTVVIWRPPTNPNGVITGYDVCFGRCDTGLNDCHSLRADDNFFITTDPQRKDNVDVQVRAVNSVSDGMWSECLPIDCENFKECDSSATPSSLTTTKPSTAPPPPPSTAPPPPPSTARPPSRSTSPPPPRSTSPPPPRSTAPPPTPTSPPTQLAQKECENDSPIYFTLGTDEPLSENSVSLEDIGENDDALMCVTSNPNCCMGSNRAGEFYGPNGVQVPLKKENQSLYRNRGQGFIRLNHRERDDEVMTGLYKCCIPNACGMEECATIMITEE